MSESPGGGTASRFCPFCGAPAVAGAGFCGQCGRPLPASGAAPATDSTAPASSGPHSAGRPRGGVGGVLVPLGVAALLGIAAFVGTTTALGGGPLGPGVGTDPPGFNLSTDGGGSLATLPPATAAASPSAAPSTPVGSASPARASPVPSPARSPRPPPTPAPTPTPGAATAWFRDDFANVGRWPVGKQELLTTSYGEGRYLLTAHSTNYPLYVWATLEGPGGAATLEATFRSSAPRTWYGLAVVDETGVPVVSALIDGTGGYALLADYTESLETRAQGHSDAFRPGKANRVTLQLAAQQVVLYVNGIAVAQADLSAAAARFGIAVQTESDGARVNVDDYRVWVAP